jgi:hypothetical protein
LDAGNAARNREAVGLRHFVRAQQFDHRRSIPSPAAQHTRH